MLDRLLIGTASYGHFVRLRTVGRSGISRHVRSQSDRRPASA